VGLIVRQHDLIPGASNDSRAVDTRSRLSWALVALLIEHPYDRISVKMLAERAGVSRSSFYEHFQDKDELLVRQNAAFGERLGEQLSWDTKNASYRFPVKHMCAHVAAMTSLYESLARSRKLDLLLKVWEMNIATGFTKRILLLVPDRAGEPPADIVGAHLASTLIALLRWWMDHHQPVSAEVVQSYFHSLIAGRTVTLPAR
jgi:AcrR family transcriptional regulator